MALPDDGTRQEILEIDEHGTVRCAGGSGPLNLGQQWASSHAYGTDERTERTASSEYQRELAERHQITLREMREQHERALRFQLARDLAVAAVGARCFGAPSTIRHLAQDAVTLADALIAALAKPQEGGG